MQTTGNYSLYIHVPFCTKKCDYCHFYVIPDQDRFKQQFMAALQNEWKLCASFFQEKELVSIYFGGGTPSLLGPENLQKILSWIAPKRAIEITLEANPEDVTESLMREYADIGVNRVSIGVQSFDDQLLQRLSRQHEAQRAIDAVHQTRQAGIENISIDLMYDIPEQTLDQWQYTLDKALKLPITHLSLYNLVIEEHTVFFKKRRQLMQLLPSPEISGRMYEMAQEKFTNAGWNQYEISAFEKPGCYSQHNVGYWTGRPFYGLGPSAFSYWEERRFRNIANINRYARELDEGRFPVDFQEKLNESKMKQELLAVELRLLKGVDLSLFEKQHGNLNERIIHSLKKLQGDGLLEMQDATVRLSKKGILFYDTVASEII